MTPYYESATDFLLLPIYLKRCHDLSTRSQRTDAQATSSPRQNICRDCGFKRLKFQLIHLDCAFCPFFSVTNALWLHDDNDTTGINKLRTSEHGTEIYDSRRSGCCGTGTVALSTCVTFIAYQVCGVSHGEGDAKFKCMLVAESTIEQVSLGVQQPAVAGEDVMCLVRLVRCIV